MELFRHNIKQQSKQKYHIYKIIGRIGMCSSIIGAIVYGAVISNSGFDPESNNTQVLMVSIGLTIILFTSFIIRLSSNCKHTENELTAFAILDNKLYHLYCTDYGIFPDRQRPINKIGRIAYNVETKCNIDQKISFIQSDLFYRYVDDVINGRMSEQGKINIDLMENLYIADRKKDFVRILYTTGKHLHIHEAFLFKSNEGYDKIIEFINSCYCKVKYDGMKVGDCFIE